jgi:hypothetical protein
MSTGCGVDVMVFPNRGRIKPSSSPTDSDITSVSKSCPDRAIGFLSTAVSSPVFSVEDVVVQRRSSRGRSLERLKMVVVRCSPSRTWGCRWEGAR